MLSQSSALSRNTVITILITVLFILYILLSVNIIEVSEEMLVFVVLNIVLFVFVMWEIWRIARTEQWRVLIQPAVLASLLHFVGAYFVPNLWHLHDENFPKNLFRQVYSKIDGSDYLNMAMLAILLALFAMWRGYRSNFAQRFAAGARSLIINKGFVRTEFKLNFVTIIVLYFISVGAVFLQISLGVFGYSSDQHNLENAASITAWLKLANDGGMLVLLLLSMAAFSERYKGKPEVWLLFFSILAVQIIVGILSGFKSQVVLPVIIVGVSYYVMNGRIPYSIIAAAMLMIVISYQIIEPFRYLRYQSDDFDNQSIASIASTVADAAIDEKRVTTKTSTLDRIITRQDLTTFTALSIAYKENKGIPETAPNFIENILLAPVNAFVPRFIWQSKTVEKTGYWYNVTVLGAHSLTRTSVGMGPVSYSYFAGGYLAIFLVFWFIGFVQRVTFETFTRTGLGGWLIYLGLLFPLVMLPSNVGGMFAGYFRIIPFLFLAQYLLLRKKC